MDQLQGGNADSSAQISKGGKKDKQGDKKGANPNFLMQFAGVNLDDDEEEEEEKHEEDEESHKNEKEEHSKQKEGVEQI